LAEAADGAELSLEGGLKHSEKKVAGIVVHGGLRSIRAQE